MTAHNHSISWACARAAYRKSGRYSADRGDIHRPEIGFDQIAAPNADIMFPCSGSKPVCKGQNIVVPCIPRNPEADQVSKRIATAGGNITNVYGKRLPSDIEQRFKFSPALDNEMRALDQHIRGGEKIKV